LRNEKAPVEERKPGVTAAQDGLEVVLESLDGTFSSIAAMYVSRGELVINVFLFEVGFEDVRALIVEALDVGPGATMDKDVVHLDIGSKDGGGFVKLSQYIV